MIDQSARTLDVSMLTPEQLQILAGLLLAVAPAATGVVSESGAISPREMSVDQVQAALVDRLRKRPDTGVCYLYLKTSAWGNIGNLTLFDPSDSRWPDAGTTTTHLGTAKSWIGQADRKIARRIHRLLQGQDLGLSVNDAVEEYIQAMHNDEHLGPDHSTVQQRRSYLRNHISAALGHQRLASLSNKVVQTWIGSMKSRKWKGGIAHMQPASKGARKAALAALCALFRFHYPSQESYPWGRIVIESQKEEAARRKLLVRQGRARELFVKKVYTPDEIRRLMLTARYFDRRLNPDGIPGILASWATPNLAVSMAFQFGFASRISELVEIREGDLDLAEGFALIPGTKSENATRYLPIQVTLRPWIEEARRVKEGTRADDHYVLRTHPAHDTLPNVDIYARRMAKVQEAAGLKLPGSRSHIYRKSHSSHATMRGIPSDEVKMLLGHAGIFGGATDEYIQAVRQMTRPEHFTYLAIPSPAELDAELDAGWTPPNLRRQRGPSGRPRREG